MECECVTGKCCAVVGRGALGRAGAGGPRLEFTDRLLKRQCSAGPAAPGARLQGGCPYPSVRWKGARPRVAQMPGLERGWRPQVLGGA